MIFSSPVINATEERISFNSAD